MTMFLPGRVLFKAVAAVVSLMLLAGCEEASQQEAIQKDKKPNIVIVLADDMGYGDITAYNPESKIPTPNLDTLAAAGMRFTDAHTPSSVCTPTRYGLLTGRYAWRTRLKNGVLRGYSPALISKDRMTLAGLMRSRDYATAVIGKWHLGLGTQDETDYSKPLDHTPNHVGFDYFYGIPASLDMPPYLYMENDRPVVGLTGKVSPQNKRQDNGGWGGWREGAIAEGFRHEEVLATITSRATEYIAQQAKDDDKPFFLYFPLNAPHSPWVPPKEFIGVSGAGMYGDFVAQVDWSMGQVMAALENAGVANNTLVIFTSDNGAVWSQNSIKKYDHAANGHWRGGKAEIYEGGHRVPFIARWPEKVTAGTTSDQLMTLTDLMATVAELLEYELDMNEAEDSYSFLSVLLGREKNGAMRKAAVHHSLSGIFAIRQGQWKLVEGQGAGGFADYRKIRENIPIPLLDGPPGQLFDLSSDPGETTNLYEEYPLVVAEVTTLLNRIRDHDRSR